MPRGSGTGAAQGRALHLEAAQGPGPCPGWRRAPEFASCKAGPVGSGYCEVRGCALLLALSALHASRLCPGPALAWNARTLPLLGHIHSAGARSVRLPAAPASAALLSRLPRPCLYRGAPRLCAGSCWLCLAHFTVRLGVGHVPSSQQRAQGHSRCSKPFSDCRPRGSLVQAPGSL